MGQWENAKESSSDLMGVTAALITLNEEKNIAACLATLSWADEIVLIDGGSRDGTLDKAKEFKPRVIFSPFQNFAQQKNRALQEASHPWVFFIDADERVSPELAEEILQVVRSDKPEAVYAIKRNTWLFGRLFQYTGTQDDYPIRLFPKAHARFEQPVHEYIVTDLPVKRFDGAIVHHSTRNRQHYFAKLEHYLEFEMQALRHKKRNVFVWDIVLRPPVKFFYLYFFKKGFLDGRQGFLFSILSAYYDFEKYKRFYFLQKRPEGC